MRRIWCEFLSPEELKQNWITDTFKEHDIMLNYKVEFGEVNENLIKMIYYYNERNIPVSLWLTLSDEDGYWINEQNCEKFYRYVENTLVFLEKKSIKIHGICIDLEPPLQFLKKLIEPQTFREKYLAYKDLFTTHLNTARYKNSVKVFTQLSDLLRSRKLESMAVGTWQLFYDLRYNMNFIQNALETPFFDIPWDSYNLMYYATLIRQQFTKKSDEQIYRFITQQVQFLKNRLGEKLAISVGCTNLGKLGTEAYYETPEEFKKDFEVIKRCGVNDFSLFSLDGLLEEKKLRSFLEAYH